MSGEAVAKAKAVALSPFEQLLLMAGAPDLFTFGECVTQADEVLDVHLRALVGVTGGSGLLMVGLTR